MTPDGYSPLSTTAWKATGKRRFIVHYLDQQLLRMAKDGHSLAIRASPPSKLWCSSSECLRIGGMGTTSGNGQTSPTVGSSAGSRR